MKKIRRYTLDNVGKYYSFTNKKYTPAVFRYSVTLKEKIDEKILDVAVNNIIKYFPTFNTSLRRGIFWYYLELSNKKITVEKEYTEVCKRLYQNKKSQLLRVNYNEKRINIEISHIISDGRGSLEFLKSILYEYISIKYHLKNPIAKLHEKQEQLKEDSFQKYYTKKRPHISMTKKVYHYKSKKRKDTEYLEYHISVQKTLKLAHKYKASITTLLVAALIYSYQKEMTKKDYKKTIKIDIPVDLRPIFKSQTTKNFFGVTSILYTYNGQHNNFIDIIKSIKKQLKRNTSNDKLIKRMNQMIYLEKNYFIKYTPAIIKEPIVQFANLLLQKNTTTCLSNIGKIKMKKPFNEYIENFNVLTTTKDLKFTICSFEDDLSIGISTKYSNNNIIKEFFDFLSLKNINGIVNKIPNHK